MQTRKDDPAFPMFNSDGECLGNNNGLTKREYFACIIMQGLLAMGRGYGLALEESVKLADELIIALNKQQSNANQE